MSAIEPEALDQLVGPTIPIKVARLYNLGFNALDILRRNTGDGYENYEKVVDTLDDGRLVTFSHSDHLEHNYFFAKIWPAGSVRPHDSVNRIWHANDPTAQFVNRFDPEQSQRRTLQGFSDSDIEILEEVVVAALKKRQIRERCSG